MIFTFWYSSHYGFLNAYGYEFLRNRAGISFATVTSITATVQKKIHNRTGWNSWPCGNKFATVCVLLSIIICFIVNKCHIFQRCTCQSVHKQYIMCLLLCKTITNNKNAYCYHYFTDCRENLVSVTDLYLKCGQSCFLL